MFLQPLLLNPSAFVTVALFPQSLSSLFPFSSVRFCDFMPPFLLLKDVIRGFVLPRSTLERFRRRRDEVGGGHPVANVRICEKSKAADCTIRLSARYHPQENARVC